MATKIRLQRHGKKGYPFYHIIVADSRSKRDGRFIEKLGTYNPNTNPATIDLNFDSTLEWVTTGAEMSDTVRAILSYKGVLYKNHLLRGVKKGALTEEAAEAKFEKWLAEKADKITKKADTHVDTKQKENAARLLAEKEKSDARAKELAAKNAPEETVEEVADSVEPAAEVKAEETPKEEKTEETPKEVKAEETSTEEKKEDKTGE